MAQDPEEQLHSACDECRSRKLRCSGDVPICKRCQDESISCSYSIRKRMGRPRKRKKSDEEITQEPPVQRSTELSSTPGIPPAQITNPPAVSSIDQWSGYNFDATYDPLLAMPMTGFGHGLNNTAACLPNVAPLQHFQQPDSCNCVEIISHILSALRNITDFQFPVSVGYLRNAIASLYGVAACTYCPRTRPSAMQNISLLNTAIPSIVDRLQMAIQKLNEETKRLEKSGGTKELKVADPADMQHHTGTADCPAGLIMQISGAQWREISATALRKLISGPDCSILDLIEVVERRQHHWHTDPEMQKLRDGLIEKGGGDGHQPGGCLFTLGLFKDMLQQLDI
ncbi:hypothetical protein BT63DRAFT_441130 [Microthyrium microscopicum]|uniref:Zn(2)-C6 fungal-type domain-containing protein n=1 Tax=Microthyrium microscopicum TaxID=703497 RepID=A0A6A6U5D8_9PEZI|nr:hypothetical protein BT63DRAFT_441130 [Microthyrium microscopicum]